MFVNKTASSPPSQWVWGFVLEGRASHAGAGTLPGIQGFTTRWG